MQSTVWSSYFIGNLPKRDDNPHIIHAETNGGGQCLFAILAYVVVG